MATGQYIYPIKREFLNLSGGTVTGATYVSSNFSADTIFSGSTSLSSILDNLSSSVITGATKVQGGINICST